MIKRLIIQNLLPGFLTWVIPFAVSFLFYKPGGQLVISYNLFKSIMIVIGSATGCYFLYRYFKGVQSHFIINGVVIGFSWYLINIILDAIILVPMMKVSFTGYFISIGLRYTIIPLISFTMGVLLNRQMNRAVR